jgi:hypothetical protein
MDTVPISLPLCTLIPDVEVPPQAPFTPIPIAVEFLIALKNALKLSEVCEAQISARTKILLDDDVGVIFSDNPDTS